ncbi:hypothetical protein DSO57_1033214 [Entomophthora muscae]|nr:hypothetical protein DSO57_1033214 [Entomophthora muscae]
MRFTAAAAIIWGILAEKLAGKVSEKLFSDLVCSILITSALDTSCHLSMLYSLIALESFSLTANNKQKLISKGLPESIRRLPFITETETPLFLEINFCMRKIVDLMKDRGQMNRPDIEKIFETVNCTINWQMSSSFWKFSEDLTEVRNDRIGFASAKGTTCITDGQWYYEVELVTGGIMQLGWSTKNAHFEPGDGVGVGDEFHSFGYDGCRNLYWFKGESTSYGNMPWCKGDVVGVYLDADTGMMQYFINGVDLGPCYIINEEERLQLLLSEEGLVPAFSLTTFQHVKVNFGHRDFVYPPKLPFSLLNDYGQLSSEFKLGPDYAKHKLLLDPVDQGEEEEHPCRICYLNPGHLMILPCYHDDLCIECITRMKVCPFCRVDISSWKTKGHLSLTFDSISLYHDSNQTATSSLVS